MSEVGDQEPAPLTAERALDATSALLYATWFRALSDATRLRLVSLLAVRGEAMTVGAITAELGVAQSTVSHHLKILAEVRFVLVEPRGTQSLYRINEGCVACFPTAADVVMGRRAPRPSGGRTGPKIWPR
jgi:DNA-binding transcriptional ArsR family regulator